METFIDKIKVAPAANIPTVDGFKTLLIVALNGATGASNYSGTAAEAATFKSGTTITSGASSTGVGATAIDDQYINVRTQAGSKYAFIEVVLADAYVSTITLPSNVSVVSRLLLQPAISIV